VLPVALNLLKGMRLPTIVIHGWSDDSSSFKRLSTFLTRQGQDVRHLYLADYLSMHDEIKLDDVALAMRRALDREAIPTARHSFNVVVHSTGSLVVRAFLQQFCVNAEGEPDPSLCPVKHLLMFAPANFGSSLAKMGKSMVGRFVKGWKWDGFMETGKRLLEALELGSPISRELALRDLFDPRFPIFDPEHMISTVIVGSAAYDDAVKSLLHENGSDGTVRVSTASLNASYYRMRFHQGAEPTLTTVQRNCSDIALAVLNRNHGDIYKDLVSQQQQWQKLVVDALSIEPDAYEAHRNYCRSVSQETFEEGRNRRMKEVRKHFHEYMHVVFRVTDQFGEAIDDYFVEFFNEGDEEEAVFVKIHSEILEKVSVNSTDRSIRTLLFDITDLKQQLVEDPEYAVYMRLIVANPSNDIAYEHTPAHDQNAGIEVFSAQTDLFVHPNCPVLVDVTLERVPSKRVFRLKMA
jgi:pimeloyl-ACP methyl ester carboxylesterase